MFEIIKVLFFSSIIHLLSVLALTSHAADKTSRDAHQLELSLSVGELSLGSDPRQFDAERGKQISLSYDYGFKSGVYIGADLIAGESGGLSPIDNIFGGDEIDYQALALVGGYRFNASNRHSLFVQTAWLHYETNLMEDGIVQSGRGNGWGLASGWEYRFTQRISVSVAIEKLEFENELSFTGTRLGFNRRF